MTMRLAIVYERLGGKGGIERYLEELLPHLVSRGHVVTFAYQHEGDAPFRLPPEVSTIRMTGADEAARELAGFRPDVVFSHGLSRPELERRAYAVAPPVFFAHAYYGACVSGTKRWATPAPRPCGVAFGPACLLRYYPRRCGGLDPRTAVALYRLQKRRLSLLRELPAIAVFSEHMRRTYVALGVPESRLHRVPGAVTPPVTLAPRPAGRPSRVLFAGRFHADKGGDLLLDAMALARRALDVPLSLTLAGDGPARAAWEKKARHLASADPSLRIEFHEWLSPPALSALMAQSDLLVMPGAWPEPWGLVGLEALARGVPVAAFAVGAIPEWLEDGRAGALAPSPPTAAGLAQAIARCLADPAVHARLAAGARETVARRTWDAHVAALETIFESAFAGPHAASS